VCEEIERSDETDCGPQAQEQCGRGRRRVDGSARRRGADGERRRASSVAVAVEEKTTAAGRRRTAAGSGGLEERASPGQVLPEQWRRTSLAMAKAGAR